MRSRQILFGSAPQIRHSGACPIGVAERPL